MQPTGPGLVAVSEQVNGVPTCKHEKQKNLEEKTNQMVSLLWVVIDLISLKNFTLVVDDVTRGVLWLGAAAL